MSLFNALFGQNSAAPELLSMLGLKTEDMGRFRDCFLKRRESGPLSIIIFTRNGGGNRSAYEATTNALRAHPEYLSDFDDDFDSTYASYEFKVPLKHEARAEELALGGALPAEMPMQRFHGLIERLKSDAKDEETTRARKVGEQIMQKINKQGGYE